MNGDVKIRFRTTCPPSIGFYFIRTQLTTTDRKRWQLGFNATSHVYSAESLRPLTICITYFWTMTACDSQIKKSVTVFSKDEWLGGNVLSRHAPVIPLPRTALC